MNYEDLKIKEKYIGKFIQDTNRKIELTNELPTTTKRYIFNMITKEIFDIYIEKDEEIIDTESTIYNNVEEIEIIAIKDIAIEATKPVKRGRKPTKK